MQTLVLTASGILVTVTSMLIVKALLFKQLVSSAIMVVDSH
jgi:hypothetical protein